MPSPFHNRLDLKMQAKHYTAPECGSINLETRKPEYCDFECPTLRGEEPMPKPHWTTGLPGADVPPQDAEISERIKRDNKL